MARSGSRGGPDLSSEDPHSSAVSHSFSHLEGVQKCRIGVDGDPESDFLGSRGGLDFEASQNRPLRSGRKVVES